MLKRVVVVVDGEHIEFEGKTLAVYNRSTAEIGSIDSGSEILIVKEGGEEGKELAVFQKWDYWKKIE